MEHPQIIINTLFDAILILGFSYVVGVMFIPLIVLDVLEGFLPWVWTNRLHKVQFLPVINFVVFAVFFIAMLLYIIWLCVYKIVWNVIFHQRVEKFYEKIYVPPKYRLENIIKNSKNKKRKHE